MIPGCEVTALCTAHRETADAAAKSANIQKSYWDHRHMARDPEIDIVVVGTKPALRHEMVMTALENQKHVYCCLPFAMNSVEARGMRDAQVSRGLIGVVDAQFRWVPALRYMKDLIWEGWLGPLYQATIEVQLPLFGHDGLIYPGSVHSGLSYPWLGDARNGASAWRNFGSHSMLALTWLFGEIDEIVGDVQTALKEWVLPTGERIRPDTADSGMALLRFKNGGRANINVGWCKADSLIYRFECWDEKGRFLVEDRSFGDAPTSTLFYGDVRPRKFTQLSGGLMDIPAKYFAVPGTSISKDNCPPLMNPMTAMFWNMADAIRRGVEGSPSFQEAAHVHEAVEAMTASNDSRSLTKGGAA
jgi:predicted dehydrogenase